MSEDLKELCKLVLDLLTSNLISTPLPSADIPTLSTMLTEACVDIGNLLSTQLLWATRRVYELTGSEDDGAREAGLDGAIDTALSVRDIFVELLQQWLELPTHEPEQSEGDATITPINHYTRSLHRQAFIHVNSLRTLYPEDHIHAPRFTYHPTPHILSLLRHTFESEVLQLKQQLDYIRDDNDYKYIEDIENDKIGQNILNLWVDTLLHPLSESLIYDIKHLNRKQMAVIFIHIIEPYSYIQTYIKHIMRSIKDKDIIKYLEVQFVALKSYYTDHIQTCYIQQATAEHNNTTNNNTTCNNNNNSYTNNSYNSNNNKSFDYITNEENKNEYYRIFSEISKKFSSTLVVGKIKDNVLLNATINFMEHGIDFALSECVLPEQQQQQGQQLVGVGSQGSSGSKGGGIDVTDANLGFLSALESYIRYLPEGHQRQLGEYLESKLRAVRPDLLSHTDGSVAQGSSKKGKVATGESTEMRILTSFQDRLAGATAVSGGGHRSSRGGKRGGRASAAIKDLDDEEDEDDAAPVKKAATTKKGPRKSAPSKSKGEGTKASEGSVQQRRTSGRRAGTASKAVYYGESDEEEDIEEDDDDEEVDENEDIGYNKQVAHAPKKRQPIDKPRVAPVVTHSQSSTKRSVPGFAFGLELEDVDEETPAYEAPTTTTAHTSKHKQSDAGNSAKYRKLSGESKVSSSEGDGEEGEEDDDEDDEFEQMMLLQKRKYVL